MAEASAPKERRLNPFAFPSETNVRFNLLIIVTVMFAFNVGLFSKPVNDLIQDLNAPDVDLSDPALAQQGMAEWKQVFVQSLLIIAVPGGLVSLVLILGIGIYITYPARIRRKMNLREITYQDDALFMNEVHNLVNKTGMSPAPRIEMEIESRFVDGQAFGFRRPYSLRLGGRLRLLFRKNPDRLRAIILHELAHIANNDVQRAYFAQAIWIAVIVVAFIPAVGIVLFTTQLPVTLIRLTQFGITLAVVAAIRASLLRVREVYADWRAMLWGAGSSLFDILRNGSTENNTGGWTRFWRLHPTAHERLDVLQSPIILFRTPAELSFLIGVLLSHFLMGAINLFGVIAMIISSSAAFGFLAASQNSDGSIILQVVIFFVMSVMILLVGLCLGFVGVYLVVGSLGLEIQKETMAAMVTGQSRWKTYLKLCKPAVLMAVGFQIGNLTIPSSILGLLPKLAGNAEGLSVLLAIILQFIGVILLTWIWFVYVGYFARHTLGKHVHNSSPKGKRLLITLISSGLLMVFYLPITIGNLIIEDIASRVTDVGVSNMASYIPAIQITIVGAVFLYVATFGVTWVFVQIHQLFRQPRCPSCKQITKKRYAVGQICEHCSEELAPWLFVSESSSRPDHSPRF